MTYTGAKAQLRRSLRAKYESGNKRTDGQTDRQTDRQTLLIAAHSPPTRSVKDPRRV